MQGEHAAYWRAAIDKELAGLVALKTWELVPIFSMPKGANIMHSHYVFTVKRNHDGSIAKFKARLVANGNTQKHGVDFDRIFSTVVKPTTLRLLLVLAACRDYTLWQIDIRQAYLQAELDVPLYMAPPPGVPPGGSRTHNLLIRSQAPYPLGERDDRTERTSEVAQSFLGI